MNVFRGYLILVATVNGVHEKNENEELRPHNIFTTAHTHTHNRFTALWILSRTTRVSQYQKKNLSQHS